jgi:aryl-alcohol dehydrogenase-like predicted oxidoreductase
LLLCSDPLPSISLGLSPYCAFSGVGLLPWSPLARGFLCGKRSTQHADEKSSAEASTRSKSDVFQAELYYSEGDHAIAARVLEVASKRGVKAAQVALAWMLQKANVSAPIIGATKMYQLEEALAAIPLQLDAEEIKYLPHAVLGKLS